MGSEEWGLAADIATAIASVLAVGGLAAVIYQLSAQRREARLTALDKLFDDLDSSQARQDREFILNAPGELLTMAHLHHPKHESERQRVENSLASLERLAYKIHTGQVPKEDAFSIYGGVLLSIACRLWPYVVAQRNLRQQNPYAHRLVYRRYLERVARDWIPQYCDLAGLRRPPESLNTGEMLSFIFSMQAVEHDPPSGV
jgi:hypothetical protein